jgi:glutamine synthetase
MLSTSWEGSGEVTEMTFIGTCDLAAVVRGRALPPDQLQDALQVGVGWVPADLALTCFDPIAENSFGSVGDLRLLPDPTTRTQLAATADRPALDVYLADQVTMNGEPWSACPRSLCQRTLEDFHRQTGLRVLASFEHEFMLQPAGADQAFSLARLRGAEPLGSHIVSNLHTAGLLPQNWLPEYGRGQFEVTIAPALGIAAADRAILLRESVRDTVSSMGRRATFAPILDPEDVGNGVHLHLSLVDEQGRNVMHDVGGPGLLSDAALRFAAGVQAHAGALVGLSAASTVSYLRLTPHRWSAGGAFVGERNREALLRICPVLTFAGRQPQDQLHLEYRAADGTGNPWLVLGSVVQAGLQGFVQDLPVPTVWPEGTSESDLAGVEPLPSDFESALAHLERDAVLAGWLGEPLLSTYLAVKRAEIDAVSALPAVEQCRRFADVY